LIAFSIFWVLVSSYMFFVFLASFVLESFDPSSGLGLLVFLLFAIWLLGFGCLKIDFTYFFFLQPK